LQKKLETTIGRALLKQEFKDGDTILVELKDQELFISRKS
jgi:ATP-dependent Clp protease ATP-binding subunit ClpA